MAKGPQPMLDEKSWPEMKRLKFSGKSGWVYFRELCKTMHEILGEQKTCEIIDKFGERIKPLIANTMAAQAKGLDLEEGSIRAAGWQAMLGTDMMDYVLRDGESTHCEYIEESATKVRVRFHPPHFIFPEWPSEAFCRSYIGILDHVAKIVNPKLATSVTATTLSGEPFCELTIGRPD